MEQSNPDKINDSKVKSKLDEWRRDLLDLTERSPLIYLNEKRVLETTAPEIDILFNRIVVKQGAFRVVTVDQSPTLEEVIVDQSQLIEDKKKTLKSQELLFVSIDRKYVERFLRKLRRASQDTYEDKGINILYLAIGLLTWKSVEHSTEIKSPLLMVPVSIMQKSVLNPFELAPSVIDDEVILNPALKTKLNNDFHVDLPNPPDDYENVEDFNGYLEQLTRMASEKGWRIEKRAFLGIFKFQKFEIYHDLEENAELISQNLIIQALAGKDVGNQLRVQGLPEEKDLDEYERPDEIFMSCLRMARNDYLSIMQ